MIDDQYIIDRFFNKKGNLNSIKLRYIKNEELNYLKLRYIDSENLNETIWRIKLNIENKPICKYCGKYKKYYKCGIYFKTCGNIECELTPL